jgi:hypothetical protein
MGEDNLIPMNERTKEEQREIARMGGIASGEARRRRKTLKDELIILLEQGDTQTKISLSLIQEAMLGNTKAFEIIRDTIGEKPKEAIEITNIDDATKEVDEYLCKKKN